MRNHPFYCVKKRVLLAIAGSVWLIAGFNVARLGVLAYGSIDPIHFWYILLSIAVFLAFGCMFFMMTRKHTKRIRNYPEEYRPVWHFFDLKAYIIMIVMMGGGIWLRYSGLVPDVFIAIFYTGLGCVLGLAGVFFWITFFCYHKGEAKA
ncbi:MAG: hypothetical protein PUC32_01355 [Oscillospiraceae bacterium]|nr:hypothetical protein [Oscillospiraceae bacterium]